MFVIWGRANSSYKKSRMAAPTSRVFSSLYLHSIDLRYSLVRRNLLAISMIKTSFHLHHFRPKTCPSWFLPVEMAFSLMVLQKLLDLRRNSQTDRRLV